MQQTYKSCLALQTKALSMVFFSLEAAWRAGVLLQCLYPAVQRPTQHTVRTCAVRSWRCMFTLGMHQLTQLSFFTTWQVMP
jgi:hypothetical protein